MTKTFEELEAKVERVQAGLNALIDVSDNRAASAAVLERACEQLTARIAPVERFMLHCDQVVLRTGLVDKRAEAAIDQAFARIDRVEAALSLKGDLCDRIDGLESLLIAHKNTFAHDNTLGPRLKALEIKILENQSVHDGPVPGAHWSKSLYERVKTLEVLLLGDEEQRAKHEDGVRRNTYPNVPVPEPGMLDRLQSGHESLASHLADLALGIEKKFEIVRKIEKMFASAIAGQVVVEELPTKKWVDQSLERLSGALRREYTAAFDAGMTKMTTAINATVASTSIAIDLARAFIDGASRVMTPADNFDGGPTVFERWVDKLASVVRRDELAREREARPSRLAMLRGIVTGQVPNGRKWHP